MNPTNTAVPIGEKRSIKCSLLLLLVMAEALCSSATADDPATTGHPPEAIESVVLDEPELTESSGLARSDRTRNRFWSHNDSGGETRIYAFNAWGRKTGQCQLISITAEDWEDMASYTDDGVARLLVADCGDNDAKRDSVSLYLLDEPDPDQSTRTNKIQKMSVGYPDGPRDCEAVAVDQKRKQIVLIAKSRLPAAGIYALPLPTRNMNPTVAEKVTASRLGTLPLSMITAMDLDPISGDIWVINYFQAFQFRCLDRYEPIAKQLARIPQAFDLPRLKQIEAVAVDRSQSVWVTSEGLPARMVRLPMTVNQAE